MAASSHLRQKFLRPLPSTHSDFLSGSFPESIFFNPTTNDEIIAIAQSLASGKAAGYNNIEIISERLAHVMNLPL